MQESFIVARRRALTMLGAPLLAPVSPLAQVSMRALSAAPAFLARFGIQSRYIGSVHPRSEGAVDIHRYFGRYFGGGRSGRADTANRTGVWRRRDPHRGTAFHPHRPWRPAWN